MSEKIIRIKNLTKQFSNKTVAVDNVTMTIDKGEFFTIVGPSGCGKTTLLHMLGGHLKPTSGIIVINNTDQTNLPAELRPINTVFQTYSLFPHMNVFDNIAFGLRIKRVDKDTIRKKVSSILNMVHLTSFGDRRPNELSGGEQQRVALARALINEPKVLLLDEPLRAIDSLLRRRILDEFKEIQQNLDMTFLYVTHDLVEAFRVSKRIAVMNKGKIRQVGTPEEIYKNPKNLFTANFICETNIIRAKSVRLEEKRLIKIIVGEQAFFGRTVRQHTQPKKRVKCHIKTNDIDISFDGIKRSNGFYASYINKQYLGEKIRYFFQLDSKHIIMVDKPIKVNYPTLIQNESYYIKFDPYDCICF